MLFAVCSGVALADGGGDKIKPLARCPAARFDYGACLMVNFFVADSRIVVKNYAPPADNPMGERTRQIVPFTGRLADGAPAHYVLVLGPREMDWDENPDTELGALPFVGRSQRNRPIILTDHGPIEIVDAEIDYASSAPDLTVVREKDMSIVARYFGAADNLFVITKSGEVGVWDEGRHVCVTPPRNVPGPLAIVTHACRAAGFQRSGDDNEDPAGNVVRAPELTAPAELIERIYNDRFPSGAPYFIERIPGTPFITITSDWEVYCC